MAKFSAKRRLGDLGEGIACQFLESKGFRILDRNYLRPWGEIDIVAEKRGVVRFIEVKTVTQRPEISREMSLQPEEMVHVKKIRKLARTAALYMESKGDGREYQIDAIGVILDGEKRQAKCRFFEQIIEDGL